MGHSEKKRLPSVLPKTTSNTPAQTTEPEQLATSAGPSNGDVAEASDFFAELDVDAISVSAQDQPVPIAESDTIVESTNPSNNAAASAKAGRAVPMARRKKRSRQREEMPQIFAVEEEEEFDWRAIFTRRWLSRNWGFVFSFLLHTVVMLMLSFFIVRVGIGDSKISLDVADAAADDQEILEVDLAGFELDEADINLENDSLEQVFESELDEEDQFDPNKLAESGESEELKPIAGGPMHRRKGDGKSATFFGTQAQGNKFVFVVDRSVSMEYGSRDEVSEEPFNRYDIAVAELLDAIASLKPHQEFLVIMFAHDTRIMFDPKPDVKQGLVPATVSNKRQFRKWLDGVQMGWGTDPRDGLELAFQLEPDAIFLLSDGAFVNERADNDPKSRDIAIRNSGPGSVPVNTVALEGESSRGSLEEIASITGGLFRFQTINHYLRQVLDTGESSLRFRAISWMLSDDRLSWDERYDLVDGQLVGLLSDRSQQNRFVAEKLLHQATWGLFEKEVTSVATNRKDAAKEWQKIARETKGFAESGQISALDRKLKDRQRLWLALARDDIESAMPLMEELGQDKFQPRAMVTLVLAILRLQKEEGPTRQSLGWLRYLGRRLDGKSKGDRDELGRSNWGYAQSKAFVESVLNRRASRAAKIYVKVVDTKRAWNIRERLAKRLVKQYPETRESILALDFLRKSVDDSGAGAGEQVSVEELLGMESQ